MKKAIVFIGCFFEFLAFSQERSQANKLQPSDLTRLSLSELMEIPVTLSSRSPEKLSESAAPISVITGEEIRRAGVLRIPEALRLAPGFNVGRVDSHTWAISSRGFNDVFANKLLVMMDGRTV